MAKDDSDFMQTLHNINKFSKRLATNNSLLTTITGDRASTKNVVEALNQTQSIMQDMKKISSDLSHMSGLLNKKILNPAEVSMKNINFIFEDIREKLNVLDGTVKAVGTYDTELLDLKEQISVGVEKSNIIIDKVDSLISSDKSVEIDLP